MSENNTLQNRTAIVTGAGRGIGEIISRSLAAHGADVVVAARTESEIQETADSIKGHGVKSIAVPTDLTSVEDIEELISRTVAEFGTPEILVNNAGANLTSPPLEQTVDEVDTMIGVNFRGVFLLTKYFAEAFRQEPADYGRVINISSVAGRIGIPRMTLYGGTKAGIYGMTRGFAAELAPKITVNSVTPGLIRIGRIDDLLEDEGEEIYDLDRIPMDRLGEPEDIADACVFLASKESSYITGADIPVDGGVTFTAGLYKL